MIRHAAAIAVALCLSSSSLHAQVTDLTVSKAAAPVHKSPSTASSVIGQATPGARLEVTRDVGDWVKISWPQAPDGIGYVRKSAGTLNAGNSARANVSPSAPAPQSASTPQSAPAPRLAAAQVEPAAVRAQAAPAQPGYVTVPSHVLGLGGHIGGASLGAGVSARAWTLGQRFGFQLDVSRYALSNSTFLTRMTSTQMGPKVLYALRDRVSDYTWIRPYAGAGAHVYRSTLTDSSIGVSTSDTSVGAQMFGGAEMTFSSMPRFGLSADMGYHWLQNPFPGYALDGLAFTFAGHWYVK